ncbi:Uncharacterized protein OBRU01_24687 [Operophtera brumata]|uniref:Malate dehydrogenase n=1 Tax=Operophtera brumata TaxID=104452 RepID=A0A0L7K5T9_OPEBR|nr:Uncharacterized protein OBRU01_24687 [Operophtera brumata]
MAGWWASKAADKGLIGMAFTNTSPLMAPTRSKQSALGTNPLSVVAPASNGETFYLDMATTAVAVGKAFNTGCLMPLGGSEKNSGYKGFGLAAMVELFCGISSGYGSRQSAYASLT